MANYLNSLVLRLGGRAPVVRPRVRGRFEPTEKNSRLPAPPLRNEITEEITVSNVVPVASPVRRSLTSAEAPLRMALERNVIEEDKHSELAAAPPNAFRGEARPAILPQIRRQNNPESPALDRDLFPHSARTEQSKTRSNANPAFMEKREMRDALFPALHGKREIRQSAMSGINDADDGHSAKHRVRPAPRKIEDRPPLQEGISELGITQAQITPEPPVRKSERRELAENGSQDIQIIIGKITVQATFPTQPTGPLPIARPAPQLTLEQYLQQRRRQP